MLRIVLTPLREFNRTSAYGLTRRNCRTENQIDCQKHTLLGCFIAHECTTATGHRVVDVCVVAVNAIEINNGGLDPGTCREYRLPDTSIQGRWCYGTNVRRTYPDRTDFARVCFVIGEQHAIFVRHANVYAESGTVKKPRRQHVRDTR